jgi:hypothetical protein
MHRDMMNHSPDSPALAGESWRGGVFRQHRLKIGKHTFDVLHDVGILIAPDLKALALEPVLPPPIGGGDFGWGRMSSAIDLDDHPPGEAHEIADVAP